MNPNQVPVGNQPEFKEDALNAKFSFSFTRRQLIILVNVLRPIQLPISDLRARILIEILDEVERTAIQSINSNDYKPLANGKAQAPIEAPPAAPVQTS